MQNKIYGIRRLLVSLEDAVLYCDISKFKTDITKIERLVSEIKEEFYEENAYKMKEEDIKETIVEVKGDILNTLEFVYKPVEVENVYDGNYLERFSERRTDELSKSLAINNHNEFWKQHTTVHGNIYGSVPCELINSNSVEKLVGYGWRRVEVDIVDYADKINDIHELIDYCDKFFDHYIIINEQSTNAPLVLHYKI